MRKGFLTLIFALGGTLCLKSQCDGCKPISGELIDYCYQERELPNRCVQFTEDSPTFYYQDNNRKKSSPMKLALPSGLLSPSSSYLMGLDPDEKLELGAADLLVIEHGVQLWQVLEGIRKWDPSTIGSGYTVLPSGLSYKPVIIGKGKTPEKGKRLNVHYTGYLENGQKFDSSLDKKQSFQFTLGAGQVIKGWDEGLAYMTVGSRYLLRIPPALGYGQAGAGGAVPPNAILYFDIQLISAE